ncbi:MAG: penicillin-binding protein activator [Candidatus Bathyarchaeia archaeon]
MEKGMLAVLMVALFLVGLGAGYGINLLSAPKEVPTVLVGEVKIGVLVDLSGALTKYGEDIRAGYEVAEEDVNAFLSKSGAKWKIKLLYENSESSAEVALSKFESFVGQGIRIVLGPMMSPQCASIRSTAQTNNVLFISPSATAVTLSIPDDNLFRFCAIDDLQGPAAASAMYSVGVRYMVSVYISNDWGVGLDSSTTEKFVSLGGTVLEHIPWSPDTLEFTPIVESINNVIQQAKTRGISLEEIGIYAVAYAQILPIFVAASNYPDLAKVRWFGTDGTVMLPELTDMKEHPIEVDFALKTKFTSTMFRIPETRIYKHVKERVVGKLGREPTIYAYSAYDSVWVVTLALAVVNEYDSMKVKEILPQVAGSYFGAIGNIVLNENGDLAMADYSLWRPVKVDGSIEWKEVGVYYSAADSVEWKED